MSVQLLYTDDSLVVCEKPAGISSESPGLPDLIREQEGYAVFPVHRLDLTTGGVCLLARSSSVCTELQRMFQQAQVIKEYYAVVYGVTDSVTGVFEDLLYHDVKTNKTFVVRTERKGVRRASCKWTALQTTETAEGLMTLLKIRLHTGRTHQIRVQFASRKMPLIGDRRYGSRIKAPFPALWSARISFPHPSVKGKTIDVSVPVPDTFPWSDFTCLKKRVQAQDSSDQPLEKQL